MQSLNSSISAKPGDLEEILASGDITAYKPCAPRATTYTQPLQINVTIDSCAISVVSTVLRELGGGQHYESRVRVRGVLKGGFSIHGR